GPVSTPDPDRARILVNRALTVVQAFLTNPAWQTSHLVITTHGGVTVQPGDTIDPAACAVWGLIRSAQTENPDRILLTDLDTPHPPTNPLPQALGPLPPPAKPQPALRAQSLWVPRPPRARHEHLPTDNEVAPVLDPTGTVLITGGTGTLGGLVA